MYYSKGYFNLKNIINFIKQGLNSMIKPKNTDWIKTTLSKLEIKVENNYLPSESI